MRVKKSGESGRQRRLFIIGANSFARELESWLDLVPVDERDWTLKGCLYSPVDPSPLSAFPTELQVVGDWTNFVFRSDDYVLLGIAEPALKEKVWNALAGSVTFMTFVAPNAMVGLYNSIGEGSIICPGVVMTTNVTLGKAVTVNVSANLGHDVSIGDFSSVMGRVGLAGGVHLGTRTYVGAGATLLPGVNIGAQAKVGAGSVVIRNVPENVTVFGNPAKGLRLSLEERFDR